MIENVLGLLSAPLPMSNRAEKNPPKLASCQKIFKLQCTLLRRGSKETNRLCSLMVLVVVLLLGIEAFTVKLKILTESSYRVLF